MPSFCKFFHMQPSEYWRLTLPEFNTLADFMQEYAREMERASHAG